MSLSTSVRLKLDRAHEHADHMEGLVVAWGHPHKFVTEVYDESDVDYAHIRYLVRISKQLPSDTLSQILGDCINNYRAVLDHLIWELSVHQQWT